MIYEVQTRMVNTWENCWTDGGVPMTFTNKREAQLEIDDLLALMPDYSPDDYRIVRLEDVLRALLADDNEKTRMDAQRALDQ
tara:strand:+ start:355 stop:600 length:246 start_codon:yes stop_codon:yes gene_type:complete